MGDGARRNWVGGKGESERWNVRKSVGGLEGVRWGQIKKRTARLSYEGFPDRLGVGRGGSDDVSALGRDGGDPGFGGDVVLGESLDHDVSHLLGVGWVLAPCE